MMKILKSFGLFDIDLFLKYTIQESTFDIYLTKFEPEMTCNG
jgi:hypothetical protein